MKIRPITFAVATYGTAEILEKNFLASPCLSGSHVHQILIQKDFISASRAYNDAIDRARNDLIVFAHQDIIFPESWLSDLERALDYLLVVDPKWGALGSYGRARDGRRQGWVFSPGPGVIGGPFEFPTPIQTLDEIVLIVRKSSGLRFDDQLPYFHLYGTDICLRAEAMGMTNYAIPAYCIHNSNQYVVLPIEFYKCCRYIRRAWRDRLPIQTNCLSITRLNLPMYRRRLGEAHVQYIRQRGFIASRAEDVADLIRRAAASADGSRAGA